MSWKFSQDMLQVLIPFDNWKSNCIPGGPRSPYFVCAFLRDKRSEWFKAHFIEIHFSFKTLKRLRNKANVWRLCVEDTCILTSELGIPGAQAGSLHGRCWEAQRSVMKNRHLSRGGRPPFQCSCGIKGNPVTHSAYYIVYSTCSVNRSCSEKSWSLSPLLEFLWHPLAWSGWRIWERNIPWSWKYF